MYSGSIPPAAINYITPVQLNLPVPKRSLAESRSLSFTQRLSPQSPAGDPKWSVQLDILSALKGDEQDYNARGAVVENISFLEDDQKCQLIEFLSSLVNFISLL
uniref:Uncharacterized protein n=1 Tax=Acrobeloides nanus TaxID=290746 RepID=A0A914BZ18_9BILA